MNLIPGTHLQGGKYRIINTLGQGGFGITYLAEHTTLGAHVCIKDSLSRSSAIVTTMAVY